MLRRYRIRVYDGAYEVLADRTYEMEIDLDRPGNGPALDRQLQALTRAAESANEPMDRPRMELWDDSAKALDWTGA